MTRLPRITSIILAILFAVATHWIASARLRTNEPLLQPYTLREDFQHDSLGQFASYPPPQDIGYEPSLAPTSEYDAPGGRALMRIVKPNRPGALRIGFIRQTFLQMSENAKLSFAFRLNRAEQGDNIEIGLAGSDGCRYLKLVPMTSSSWTNVEVALSDFRCNGKTLALGVGLEAFYIVADIAHGDADVTYRFLIDNIALTSSRKAGFDVRLPNTASVESLNAVFSLKSFATGDTLSLSAGAPARLKSVTCVLASQDGSEIAAQPLFDDGTHGDERADDGVWSNNAVYVLRAHDQPGVWQIKLDGLDANGRSVRTEVRLIRRGPNASSHPRLYFSAADKASLLARSHNPKAVQLWEGILAAAKMRRGAGDISHGGAVFALLDKQYLLPSLLAYFDVLNQARLRIAYNALVAYVTNDAEARREAKAALLDAAGWSDWAPPWFRAHGQHTYYPAGQLAAEVAFGYDLLYEDLTEAERSLVRATLIRSSIAPTYREYVLDNRVMANTSNWIAHTVGGALIAACAIAGDMRDEDPKGQFDVYVNSLLLKMEGHLAASYLSDGSYGEGISYQEFDLETTLPALTALRRVFGIDYWQRTHVRDSLTYPLYTYVPSGSASPDMGDSHPPSGRTIAALVAKAKDPTLRWFYDQFSHSSITDFLFFDDSIIARGPQLPTSRIFRDKGNVVFRTGWNKDDWVFLFRAGANFNHNHADQGAFLLTAFGEPLITEAGWSDYYKDPYYSTFFTQAIGHNTVLIDGNPESQDLPDTRQFPALNSYPTITDSITSDFYDAVSADLTSVYRRRLSSYTRRIVFVKPHYYVVFDDLTANGEPAKFDFLLHLPDRSRIKTSPGLVLFSADKASLAVRPLVPADAALRVRDGRLPYATFATNTPRTVPAQPAFLDIQATKPARRTHFLVALAPARTNEEAGSLAAKMSEITGNGFIGARVERGDEHDLVVFQTGGTNDAMRYGDWTTDAAAWTVTQSGGRLKLFAVQNSHSFGRTASDIYASDKPASIAANYTRDSVEAACYAITPTKIQLFVGFSPARVLLDGRDAPMNFNRAASSISLTVPAGQHQLKIELH